MADKKEAKMSRLSLISLSLGSAISSGIIMFVGIAALYAGEATWFAYVVSAVAALIMMTPVALFTSTTVVKSSFYTIPTMLWGKRAGGYYIVLNIFTLLGMAATGLTLGIYINMLWPVLPPNWIAVILFTFFFITNLCGVNVMALVQNISMVLLLGGLLLFMVIGLPMVDWSVFKMPENGIDSQFLQAVAFLCFLGLGGSSPISFGKFCKHPKKDVPWAVFMTWILLVLLYMPVIFVYTGVLPYEQYAGQPLGTIAKAIMNPVMYVLFMIGGPIMALATTMNTSYTVWTAPFIGACADGWFPRKLGELNKNGQPKWLFLIVYLWCVIPAALNIALPDVITNFLIVSFICQCIITLSIMRMPKTWKQWETSHLHMPNGVLYLICILFLIVTFGLAAIMFTRQTLVNKLMLLAACIFSTVYVELRYRSGKVKVDAAQLCSIYDETQE